MGDISLRGKGRALMNKKRFNFVSNKSNKR